MPAFLLRKTEKGTQHTSVLHSTPEHVVTLGGVLPKNEEAVYGGLILFVQKEHGGERTTTLVGTGTDFGSGLNPEPNINTYLPCI